MQNDAVEVPLLERVPEATRQRVLGRAHRHRYERGEIVFHEQDVGDTLHLITEGHLAVQVGTVLGDTATLTVLGPGDSFGEIALVAEYQRTASIVALEPSETLALHRHEFEALRAEDASVNHFLVEILARQVSRLTTQLIDAYYLPAEHRVLRRLADLADVYYTPRPPIVIPLHQEMLATLAGTSRPTVNRVLGEAAAEGIVSLTRGRVTVLDVDALKRKAESG